MSEVRFAASPNPGREHINFELPTSLAEEITSCAGNAFNQDISVSRSDVIRAALILSLPTLREHPALVKLLNQNYVNGNVKFDENDC